MRTHYPVQVRADDSELLTALKAVTRLSKTEIASQALDLFFQSLPKPQRNEVLKTQAGEKEI